MNRAVSLIVLFLVALLFTSTSIPGSVGTASAQQPQGFREFVIKVWSWSRSTPAGRELLDRLKSGPIGTQSRDIGDLILAAADRGDVKLHPSCDLFRFEFLDANYERGRDAVIWVNGVKRMFDRIIPIEVCGEDRRKPGVLVTTIKPAWNTPQIAVEVHSPFMKPFRRYPSRSASLKTPGPATEGRHAGIYTPDKPTSISKRLETADVTYFQFVVE